ncbi:MAG: OB-fold nucleic acid binding domain-containing protein [Chloroflexota bacterium]|nr:OB-fold nucleic acid binding domain-containing protein [Chloroflexota bacterium]
MRLSQTTFWIPLALISIMLTGCSAPTPTASPHPPTLAPTDTATARPTATFAPTATPTLAPSATPAPSTTPTAEVNATATETITPTSRATAAPTADDSVPIGELDANSGDGITIKGRVIATASFSQGFKFTVDDGSGQLVLLLWHTTYDETPAAPRLNLGATVRATGKIGAYEGELQITPYSGSDVTVLSGGYAAPDVAANALGEHLGERVTLTGQVSRVEGAGTSAVKVYLTDESGEALVFLWNNILDRIPHANPALGTIGTAVRATGEVAEYKGTLELIPTLPYDVEVLP